MTEAVKARAPTSPLSQDADEQCPRFDTVRSIYDAMYRGEIDEAQVVEQLSELREREYSLPGRMMAMISRR